MLTLLIYLELLKEGRMKNNKSLLHLKQNILTLLDHPSIVQKAQSYLNSRNNNNLSAGFLAYLVQGNADIDLNQQYILLAKDKQLQARLKAIKKKVIDSNSSPPVMEVESDLAPTRPAPTRPAPTRLIEEDFSEIEVVVEPQQDSAQPGTSPHGDTSLNTIDDNLSTESSFADRACNYFNIEGPFNLSSLKKAYRKMAVTYHPDKAKDQEIARQKFLEVKDFFELAQNYFTVSERITLCFENISSAIDGINASAKGNSGYQNAIELGMNNTTYLVEAINISRQYKFLLEQELKDKEVESVAALMKLFTALCEFQKKGPWPLVTNAELNLCFDKIIHSLSVISPGTIVAKPEARNNFTRYFSYKVSQLFESIINAGKKIGHMINQIKEAITSMFTRIIKGVKHLYRMVSGYKPFKGEKKDQGTINDQQSPCKPYPKNTSSFERGDSQSLKFQSPSSDKDKSVARVRH